MRIDWQHVENAMGYYVYRSTSKSGTYSLIGRVAFSSAGYSAIEGNIDVPNPGCYIYYEDSTATGTKYYYKVQAFDKDGNTGSQSKAVASSKVGIDKNLSTPTIVSVKSGKTGLRITWNQNSDYDDSNGFSIYRSTDPLTGFAYIGYAEDDYSFVDTSSSDGTEYYYAVQADKSSGSTVLGESIISRPVSARYDSSIRHVDSITLTGINKLDNHEEIEPGETLQLGANVSPSNATDKSVTWRSTDPTIVRVDSTGLVTGVSYGTAKIICRSVSDPEVRASRIIYVGEDEEELDFLDVEIDEANQKIKVRASGDWTAATDEWITLSKYSGTGRETITYTLAENEDEDDRTGNISFICGTETQNLSITQEGSDGGVSVVHVNYGAGTEVTDPEVTVVHVDYGAGTHVINNTYSITITHPILGTIVDDGTQIISSFGVWNGNGIMNWEVSGSSIWHVDMGNCSWLTVTKVNNNQLQIKTLSGVSPCESRKAQFSLHVGTQCLSFEVIQKGPDVIVSHSYEDKNFYNRNGEGDDTFAMLTAKDGTASNLQVNSTEPWSAYVVKQVDGAWTQSTSDWVEVSCTNTVLTLTNKEGSDKTREREEYIKIDVAPYSSIVIRITRPKATTPLSIMIDGTDFTEEINFNTGLLYIAGGNNSLWPTVSFPEGLQKLEVAVFNNGGHVVPMICVDEDGNHVTRTDEHFITMNPDDIPNPWVLGFFFPDDLQAGTYWLTAIARGQNETKEVKVEIKVSSGRFMGPVDRKYPGTLTWPIKLSDNGLSISSPVGPREPFQVINGNTSSANHHGTDIGVKMGAEIRVVADGLAYCLTQYDKNGNYDGYGNYVIVDHQNGYYSMYAHMSSFADLVKGSSSSNRVRVNAGDIIGYVGMTGDATGPHLHYELEYCERGKNQGYYYSKDWGTNGWEVLNNLWNGYNGTTTGGWVVNGIQDYSFIQ